MDWRQFAKDLLLADGRITELETQILKRAVHADRVVDREEIAFLVELKRAAVEVDPAFDHFFFEVLKRVVLKDGQVTDDEARWLRKSIMADNEITPIEVKFVKDLKKAAVKTGAEFNALYDECMGLSAGDFSKQ